MNVSIYEVLKDIRRQERTKRDTFSFTKEYVDVIKTVLEKEIDEPVDEMDEFYESLCPKCSYLLDDTFQYCPNCGQRLDWGNDI